MSNYLDKTGLKTLWGRIVNYISKNLNLKIRFNTTSTSIIAFYAAGETEVDPSFKPDQKLFELDRASNGQAGLMSGDDKEKLDNSPVILSGEVYGNKFKDDIFPVTLDDNSNSILSIIGGANSLPVGAIIIARFNDFPEWDDYLKLKIGNTVFSVEYNDNNFDEEGIILDYSSVVFIVGNASNNTKLLRFVSSSNTATATSTYKGLMSASDKTKLNSAVTGPASATNNVIAVFDGTTGKKVKVPAAVNSISYFARCYGLVPLANNVYDLGNEDFRWRTVCANNISCYKDDYLDMLITESGVGLYINPGKVATKSGWPIKVLSGNNTEMHFGNITATTGSFVSSSDERLKDITRDIFIDIETIAEAPAIGFEWKDKSGGGAGTIAQYWEKIVPEVISKNKRSEKDETEYLALQYGNLALIAAINIAKEVKALKEEVKALKEEIKNLRK